MQVLGHSLVRSLRSLIRLFRAAHFARALRCTHSFARSAALARSLAHFAYSGARGKVNN